MYPPPPRRSAAPARCYPEALALLVESHSIIKCLWVGNNMVKDRIHQAGKQLRVEVPVVDRLLEAQQLLLTLSLGFKEYRVALVVFVEEHQQP